MKEDEKDYRSFLDGNQVGFEALVCRYREPLIYFIYRYVNNMHLAEELAQDAFVEILLHKERYHFKTSFKTYLFTIGKNKSIDYIRKHHKEILGELSEADYRNQEENPLEETVIQEEEKLLVKQALTMLKDEYRQVLYLIEFEELSYREAAKVMNKNIGQVKILVFRARKALRNVLEKEGYCYEK